MKFVIYPEHGIKQVSVVVWDAINNTELCAFVDGVFETEDEIVIDKLLSLGYEYEGMLSEPEPQAFASGGIVNVDDLMILGDNGKGEVIVPLDKLDETFVSEEFIRAKAKEFGIKSWHVKSIETLTAEIAEKEGA